MPQMVSLLLQMGAKTSARDSLERTVDDWVEKYRLKNVKDLLEHRCGERGEYLNLQIYMYYMYEHCIPIVKSIFLITELTTFKVSFLY